MTHDTPTNKAMEPVPVTQAELKPCPFCGEQPKWKGTPSDYARGLYRLQCLGETHLIQSYGPSEGKAIAAWNTRADTRIAATALPDALADGLAEEREAVRNALYEGLSWFGTLPEPEGDVPERYHRWDDLGEFADRILTALRTSTPQPAAGEADATRPDDGLAGAVQNAIENHRGFIQQKPHMPRECLDSLLGTLELSLAAFSTPTRCCEETREAAAAWHDQRARDTPDAFEMEFHQASATAIRSMPLPGTPLNEKEGLEAQPSLVERLRARCTVSDEFSTVYPLVNPDGPEAADRIEQLEAALQPAEAQPSLVERATWFRIDPSTGEWTGEYCSVKPADDAHFVAMIPVEQVAALQPAPDQVEALREALVGPEAETGGRIGWLHALLIDLREKINSDAAFRALWADDDPQAAYEALAESETLVRDTRAALAAMDGQRKAKGGEHG